MKIRTQTKDQGGALVLTLLTALIIGVTLASYLTLVSSQNASTMRSMAWNSAIPVVESGVEAALTHLHYQGVTNLVSNGWQPAVGGAGKSGTLDDGTSYQVTIEQADPAVIICLAQVPAPLSPSANLGMILGSVVNPGQGQTVRTLKRKVRVTAKRDPFFSKAMVAKGQINLNGNNVQTDSFDSEIPAYNTLGKYDASKALDHGDVATNSGLVNSVNAGNADIRGKVSTGPNGTAAIGPNGSVGSDAWVDGGNNGIEPGYIDDDMNMDIKDVDLPAACNSGSTVFTSSLAGINLLAGSIDPRSPTYFKLTSFSGKVNVTGHVVVYIPAGGTFNFTGGNSGITIAPGGSLTVYVGASSAKIGSVVNPGSALNFSYYGLLSNTDISFSGNGEFSGTIYAPQANLSLGGGGNNNMDFVGSCVTAAVTLNGHFNFHYDEALARRGPARDYIVQSWNEIAVD